MSHRAGEGHAYVTASVSGLEERCVRPTHRGGCHFDADLSRKELCFLAIDDELTAAPGGGFDHCTHTKSLGVSHV
jgi:hypothetical protein